MKKKKEKKKGRIAQQLHRQVTLGEKLRYVDERVMAVRQFTLCGRKAQALLPPAPSGTGRLTALGLPVTRFEMMMFAVTCAVPERRPSHCALWTSANTQGVGESARAVCGLSADSAC